MSTSLKFRRCMSIFLPKLHTSLLRNYLVSILGNKLSTKKTYKFILGIGFSQYYTFKNYFTKFEIKNSLITRAHIMSLVSI